MPENLRDVWSQLEREAPKKNWEDRFDDGRFERERKEAGAQAIAKWREQRERNRGRWPFIAVLACWLFVLCVGVPLLLLVFFGVGAR